MTMALTQVTTGGVDENINIDSNTLKVDGTNNRVGIGTAAPSGLLHLAASSQPSLYFEDTGSSNTLSRVYKSGSALTFNSRHTSAGQFVFNSENSGGTVTERMRIDASGNVGIGSSPVADAVLTLSRETDTALFFRRGGGTNQDAAIRCAGGDFQFLNGANSSTVAGLNERMRIDNLGNVGIGNASPTNSNGYNTLTLGNGTSTGGQIHLNNSAGANFYLWHDSQGANIYNQSASSQIFYTAAAERMRVDQTGRLLIGTSSGVSSHPLLQVKGYVNGATGPGWMALSSGNTSMPTTNENMGLFSFFRNDGGESARIECEADANQSSTSANGRLVFMTTRAGDTSPTESMRINSSGNVSIGTSAATANLNVYGGASAALFQNSNTGTGSGDGFFVGNWGGLSASVWQYENDIINFGTNNAERVRIDNSGRLMVGRTTATHKLSLAGAANDKTAEIQLTASNVASGYIGPNSDGLNIGTDTAGIVFKTGVTGGGSVGATGTTRFSISSSGVITTNTVQQHFDRGSSTGQSSFTRDFTIGNTQSALVIAAFNHYGLFSYGCTRMSFAATGASFSTSDIHNQTSTPGGSWSISKPNNTTLRITKNAGNYNGSGHWFIHIIAS